MRGQYKIYAGLSLAILSYDVIIIGAGTFIIFDKILSLVLFDQGQNTTRLDKQKVYSQPIISITGNLTIK